MLVEQQLQLAALELHPVEIGGQGTRLRGVQEHGCRGRRKPELASPVKHLAPAYPLRRKVREKILFPVVHSLVLPSLVRRLASALAAAVLFAAFSTRMIAGDSASRGLVGDEPVQESAVEDGADWSHLAFAASDGEQRAFAQILEPERKCTRGELGFDRSSIGGE